MDSFFGIGLAELAIILILAGIFLGPQRIRDIARTLGRWTAELRRVTRGFTQQLNAELDAAELADLREALNEVKALRRQVSDLRGDIRQATQEFSAEGKAALRESRDQLTGANANGEPRILPPQTEPPLANPTGSLPNPLEISDDPDS